MLVVGKLVVGKIMEDTKSLLMVVNDDVKASKMVLEELANDVRALADIVHPLLVEHVKVLRSSRMAAVAEVRDSIAALREVRTFFLESNYEKEMQRLERFVAVCREIQQLKSSGVFDAVCDSAIRMAVKEEGKP
jgi:hypothetical protein